MCNEEHQEPVGVIMGPAAFNKQSTKRHLRSISSQLKAMIRIHLVCCSSWATVAMERAHSSTTYEIPSEVGSCFRYGDVYKGIMAVHHQKNKKHLKNINYQKWTRSLWQKTFAATQSNWCNVTQILAGYLPPKKLWAH